jgi:hypothetical protein
MILILEIHTIGGRLEDYIDLEHDVTITMRRTRMERILQPILYGQLLLRYYLASTVFGFGLSRR